MIEYYKNKANHTIFGKTHTKKALALISKRKSKYPLGVGLYDLDGNLISKFKNNVELAKHLTIFKVVTVGKYLNSDFVYNNTYRFKLIEY